MTSWNVLGVTLCDFANECLDILVWVGCERGKGFLMELQIYTSVDKLGGWGDFID